MLLTFKFNYPLPLAELIVISELDVSIEKLFPPNTLFIVISFFNLIGLAYVPFPTTFILSTCIPENPL
jgi:hypothetical protein